MNATQDVSIDELRRRSERTRADLTATIHDLKDKVGDTATELKSAVSPANIKHEIKTYVREQGDSFVESARRKAQENPLQAIAVGAAIAYPAWGLLRAIPTPLLMIGAGLWLTSAQGKQTALDVSADVADAVQRGTAIAGEYAEQLKGEISNQVDAAGHALSDFTSGVSGKASAAADQIRATAHDVRDAIASRSDAALSGLSNAAAGVTGAAAEMTGHAGRHAVQAQDSFAQTAKKTQNLAMDLIDRSPLLVAGIGVAIGAFIAGALPKSDVEDRMLGKSSDDLKMKAREAATSGFDQAKDVATGVATDVAAALSREGLDGDSVKNAVTSAADGAKSLVEKTVETALGVEQAQPPAHQQNQTLNKG